MTKFNFLSILLAASSSGYFSEAVLRGGKTDNRNVRNLKKNYDSSSDYDVDSFETVPCVPFDDPQVQQYIDPGYGYYSQNSPSCLDNTCDDGCCRIREWPIPLYCDRWNNPRNSLTHEPCVCNGNTNPPGRTHRTSNNLAANHHEDESSIKTILMNEINENLAAEGESSSEITKQQNNARTKQAVQPNKDLLALHKQKRAGINKDAIVAKRAEMKQQNSAMLEKRAEMKKQAVLEKRAELKQQAILEQRAELKKQAAMEKRAEMKKQAALEQREKRMDAIEKRAEMKNHMEKRAELKKQAMMEHAANQHITMSCAEEFHEVDQDSSGFIMVEELQTYISDLVPTEQNEIMSMFHDADEDKNGAIDISEFCSEP